MNTYENNYNRFWYIRIIAAILCLAAAIKFMLPFPGKTTAKADGSFIVKNMVYEQSEAINTESATITEATTNTAVIAEATTNTVTEKPSAVPLEEYETPSDILTAQQEYIAAFADSEEGGSVEEVFFKTSGATDIIGEISIKNATATKKPDFDSLIKEGTDLTISDKSKPIVLIFHTHTTESYLMTDNGVFYSDYKTRSEDPSKNMVRVGDEICRVLESNGIGYIHDTEIYDKTYDGAYSRSREAVKHYLELYPSIQIVIDVHRDAIYYSDTSRCKPTAEINGKKAAQLMIISGAQEGYITDFPYWEDNLRFSLSFHSTAQKLYPGLMKPLYFCQRKYNMDLTKYSFLLEVGTDANTLEEAVYSGYLTGNILTEIINEASE